MRDLELEKGDKVYLKISQLNGVVRLGKKGKLCLVMWGPIKFYKGFVRCPMNWDSLVNWVRFIWFPCFYVEKVYW